MALIKRPWLWEGAVCLVIGLAALEAASFLLTKANLFLINETPTAYKAKGDLDFISLDDWRIERDDWGAWHVPNARTLQRSPCFSVQYASNEVGARDRPFAPDSGERRYLLIGDSFAEGYGVEEPDRAQAHLENATGVRILNFGAAGAIGPVQYWLIYERLARRYRHDGMIVFFYPANDFTENDYQFWLRTKMTFTEGSKERYRPYYAAVGDGTFKVVYPPNAERGTKRSRGRQFLIDYFWSANALRTVKMAWERRFVAEREIELRNGFAGRSYSGYFDATAEQQRAAVYFVEKLLSESKARDIVLIAIPAAEDFARVGAGQKREGTLWWPAFKSARERLRRPITFVDLVDFKPSDMDALFYPCDGHWTPYGNKWAADHIGPFLGRQ
jgi:hypothetical protein